MFWKQLVKLRQVSVFCLKTICLSSALHAAMKPQSVKQNMFVATWTNDPVQAQGFKENGQTWMNESLSAQNNTSRPTVSQARNCCAIFLLKTICLQLNSQNIWTRNLAVLRQAHFKLLQQECAAMKAPQTSVKQNKWVLMWRDLASTNWYAVLLSIGAEHQTTVGSIAAENQLLTSYHGVYRDQKCKLAKHNAENHVCKPFYAVSSAMTLIDDTRERCNQKSPTSCRAYEIMRMMWCVGNQNSFSQMIFLLKDFIRLQIMDSKRSTSCRT